VTVRELKKEKRNSWLINIAWIIAGYSTVPGLIHLNFYMEPKYLYALDFNGIAIGGAIYAGGAVLDALRFPERFFKGYFDNLGNSHNIFHVCCLIGAAWHWRVNLRMFQERQLFVCPT
jgi:adiponectin receptor